ncbi:YcaO-like family protein [Kibdelosporangium philippinense]|uniref:YcaO-like family protein n=1 Tax=Kibdelosporangium philippinense TaxID=211113 RepID=A0ABS8ZHJ7_9PSEU|nr:YcaO-like family protein [Kibdelosporangium philippinense]MCE7005958.1 YcaO-like family protein [Kibdelosporangium philippinense]
MSTFVSPVGVQFGERDASLADAWQHGLAAAAELGLTVHVRPVPAEEPGAWRCTLYRDGDPVGVGFGEGQADVAEVGALYEALEHHVFSAVPDSPQARTAHEVGDTQDAALALLLEGPDEPVSCIQYRSLITGDERDVPLFLFNPNYLNDPNETYDYTALSRYSCNDGWAAGTTATEAIVHALNEAIERDAMSLLLIDQFLAAHPHPLRVVDPATLSADLHDLWLSAQTQLSSPVWLLEMPSDLSVPVFWAYTPVKEPGQPPMVRGSGASLSWRCAIERALTELIQNHSIAKTEPELLAPRRVWTESYPALHQAHLADFTERLVTATVVPFIDSVAPDTPQGHLVTLVELLRSRGFDVLVWERYVSRHLAVLNVFVPGLERFDMVTTDGQVVVPGPRGRALLRTGQAGERVTTLDRAASHGWAAVAELGLTAEIHPVPHDDPVAWHCRLYRDERPTQYGMGTGKGAPEAAKTGAVFEALEHHISLQSPSQDQVVMRAAKDIVVQDAGRTTALTLLSDGEVGCARYVSLVNGASRNVPLFLSIPDYEDSYDYSTVARYSSNNGWAAGVDVVEAIVHAINETIERDAMSLLLIEQFLTPSKALRVLDTRTLPTDLAQLHIEAEARLKQPVWLLDMTTDLGVAAYWAYTPAAAGQPATIRGCGASLSAHYAVERALTELIQLHTTARHKPDLIPKSAVWTEPYPALHRCYLADFSTRMTEAREVAFASPPHPATPQGHLDTLVHRLSRHGCDVLVWERYVSANLAVLNVFIPGAENFMAVTDGQVVIPGRRGRRHMAAAH